MKTSTEKAWYVEYDMPCAPYHGMSGPYSTEEQAHDKAATLRWVHRATYTEVYVYPKK